MIKYSVDLYTTAEEFYNLLEKSVLAETKRSKIKKIKTGMVYEKEMRSGTKKSQTATITVDSAIPNQEYASSIKAKNGSITKMKYEIVDNGDTITVNYIENYVATGFSDQLNHKFVSLFYGRQQKKRMQQLLYAMEKHILESRPKATEDSKENTQEVKNNDK